MKSEPELVLELIREVGVHRLANWDGCICSHFSIRNVNVDMSCGKGRDRGLWIESRSGDYENGDHDALLRPIAEEVVRQAATDGRGPMPIHFHEWKKP